MLVNNFIKKSTRWIFHKNRSFFFVRRPTRHSIVRNTTNVIPTPLYLPPFQSFITWRRLRGRPPPSFFGHRIFRVSSVPGSRVLCTTKWTFASIVCRFRYFRVERTKLPIRSGTTGSVKSLLLSWPRTRHVLSQHRCDSHEIPSQCYHLNLMYHCRFHYCYYCRCRRNGHGRFAVRPTRAVPLYRRRARRFRDIKESSVTDRRGRAFLRQAVYRVVISVVSDKL